MCVLVRVNFETQETQPFADYLTERCAVFSYAASEDEGIQASEYGQHCADFARQTMGVNVESQLRSRVAGGHGLHDFLHVARDARDSPQAGFLVQNSIQLFGGVAAMAY